MSNSIPVYYSYQNRKDKTTNVFTFPNIWGQNMDIKVKHVLMHFPHSFQNQQFHFRFKIQCEKPQKQMAWLDILNMNAKAPIINGAIHMKILELQDGQTSKIYTQEKLVNLQNMKQEEINRIKANQFQHNNNNNNNSENNVTQQEKDRYMEMEKIRQQEERAYKLEREKKRQQEEQAQRQQQQSQQQHQFSQPVQQQKQQDDLMDFSPKNDQQIADDWGLDGDDNVQEETFNKPQKEVWGNQDLLESSPKNQQQQQNIQFGNNNNNNGGEFNLMGGEDENNYVVIDGVRMTREQLKQQKLDKIEKEKQQKIEELQKAKEEEEQKKQARLDMAPQLKERINNWAIKDKQRQNIRKLLSSVHDILWEGNTWTPVNLSDLLDDRSVKKAYQKALLKIHPDKNRGKGPEIEYLAENIINEIKLAYDEYRNQNN